MDIRLGMSRMNRTRAMSSPVPQAFRRCARRRTSSWMVAACLLLACLATPPAAAGDVARQASVVTTIGEFRAVRDPSGQHAVILNGKVLVENGPSPVFLSPLLRGKGQDFILIFKASTGSACRGMFHAVRIKSPVVVSEAFGTCAESFSAKVEGDRLIVTMPAHVAEPELLDKADRDRLSRTEHVYTYVDGLLSEREVQK